MRHQDVHDDELIARLHEAAEAHEPDRSRILARLERGMAAQSRPDHRATRPPVFGWVRVVSATAAVASVLAIGGYAVASAVKNNTPAEQTVSVSPTPTPTPSPDATSRTPVKPVAPSPSSGSGDTSHSSPEAGTSPTAPGTAAPSAPPRCRPPPVPRTAPSGRTVRSTRAATTSGHRATSPSRRPSNSPHSPSS